MGTIEGKVVVLLLRSTYREEQRAHNGRDQGRNAAAKLALCRHFDLLPPSSSSMQQTAITELTEGHICMNFLSFFALACTTRAIISPFVHASSPFVNVNCLFPQPQ